MSDHAPVPESDSPITTPKADRLGRGEIAVRLYGLLTTAPAEWPVRVALLGAWGEGKTSVAKLVEASATKDKEDKKGDIVITYPVSSIASVEDLWLGFCRALSDAVAKAGLLQPHELPYRRLEIAAGITKGQNAVGAGAETIGTGLGLLAGVPALGTLIKSATSFGALALRQAIGVDAETAGKIRDKLGPDRRVIVILDDLDRADPRVVPELLLRLRDLLELPQFSFLVPFDRGVVARTLTEHHKAWEDPDRFLEKIFDYQIDLPEPAPSARLRMIEGEIERHCSFIPPELPTRLRDALPPSPRKLKSLIRHLYLYRDEAARHDDGEIDWWTVLCFELLRQVSPRHRQLAIDALERWPEHEREDTRALSREDARRKLSTHNDLQTFVFRMFDDAAPKIGPSKEARAVIIAWLDRLPKWRDKAALGDIRLLETSSLVSAGEWRKLFEKSQEERCFEPVRTWIGERSRTKAVRTAEMAAAVVRRALERRGRLLAYMSDRALAGELVTPADEALVILDLVERLLPEIDTSADVRDDVDQALVAQIADWCNFNRNRADGRLREHEAGLLKRRVLSAGKRAEWLLSVIEVARSDAIAHEAWRQLKHELIDDARPILAGHLRDDFREPEGWRRLAAHDALLPVRELALGEDSPLWRRDDALSLWSLLEPEAVSPQVAGNAFDFLNTCVSLLAYLDGSQELARTFLAYEDRVEALWKAAMSHRWQFRRLHDCRELRRRLIEANGALEPVLPEPSWLREGEPEDPS